MPPQPRVRRREARLEEARVDDALRQPQRAVTVRRLARGAFHRTPRLFAVLISLFLLPHSAMGQVQAPRAMCDGSALTHVLHGVHSSVPSHARAIWLDARTLRWPHAPADGRYALYASDVAQLELHPGAPVRGARSRVPLSARTEDVPAEVGARFAYVADGATLTVPGDQSVLDTLYGQQLLLVREDAQGNVLEATGTQLAGALDARYAAAESIDDLGVRVSASETRFRLWAPTAYSVMLCVYPSPVSNATRRVPLTRDPRTGAWSVRFNESFAGQYYRYFVTGFAPGAGVAMNRVTDPYSVGLSANSERSAALDLTSNDLMPAGWLAHATPTRVHAPTDLAIYELHVRDFSLNDPEVPPAHRGKYLAFTESTSFGVRHLRGLAEAGITDVHLLPVFDIATIPEEGCVTPKVSGGPASEEQQVIVMASADRDCFNWGYDPFHYTVPEGSYATDAMDARVRIREFRRMVQALHGLGLRVGMDVVYNHTSAGGLNPHSVLDRIVPGYYHRLSSDGRIENSTCCSNTATEHPMMAKLMIESAVTWATQYRIDSFRFDLMGHQPRAAMERLQLAVDSATGRHVHLIGEGWNFGEVADGRRFVQASQLSLTGSGIATFSDRGRDAVRGGSAGDNGADQVARQGYINGLAYDRNAVAPAAGAAELRPVADMVRVGLAGSLRSYRMEDANGVVQPLASLAYGGSQPAGYVSEPGEVVNYVENHDNQTLFDLNVFKLPLETSREDRARVSVLGSAIVALSQGIAYFHAGQELLRSKSMDRNSYDSGDWFNRLDFTMRDNGFGRGLPPKPDNEASWGLMRPRLADTSIAPSPDDIRFARDATLDLLRIRRSTPLFRLRTAREVEARLHFHNTGPSQEPTVIVGELDGRMMYDATYDGVLYAINVDTVAHRLVLPELAGRAYVLHPVHRAPTAADRRAASATWAAGRGALTVPARTAVVWVLERR
jgi:pullulanase/glycogen debranching enzyme